MNRIVAILGPTGSGKTEMAIDIAEELGGEVVSVDSMQIYRGMDIGTAKPTAIERRGIRHHMIDIVEPDEEFSVAEYRRRGRRIIETARVPLVIAGGSGLHFRALVDPMSFAPTDPQLRARLEDAQPEGLIEELLAADDQAVAHVDVANRRRLVRAVEILRLTGETPTQRARTAEADDLRRYVPEIPFTALGVDPGHELDERISHRLSLMRRGGLTSEVRGLQGRLGKTASRAVGYRELLRYLIGEITEAEAYHEAERHTKKLARRQRTWFQRDPRIRWIPWVDEAKERSGRALEAIE